MKNTIIFLAAAAVTAACSSQSQEDTPKATDYLVVKFTETGSPDSCRVERLSTIRSDFDIYMIDFDRYLDGRKQMLSQLQFSGHDGIDYVRDRSVLLTYEGAPCDSYSIEWRNLECTNWNRDEIECPEIKFEGEEIFNSISIEAK